MKTIEIHDGIHFVDLQRLIFARRGKACPVFGLDSLAGRLRAGRFFKARLANVPVSAASARRSWLLPSSGALSPFFGRIGRIGRMVWKSEITVARWEMLAVLALVAFAVGLVLSMVF